MTKKGNVAPIVLGFIALAALIAVGAVLFTAKPAKNTNTARANQPVDNANRSNTNGTTLNANTPVNGNAGTNTAVDMSGWEMYVNEVTKYTIQIPPDWTAKEGENGSLSLFPPDFQQTSTLELGSNMIIRRTDTILPPDPSPETAPDNCVFNTKDVTINGIVAIQQDEECFATMITTYIPTEDQFIKVFWAEVFERPEYRKILSTFSFLP